MEGEGVAWDEPETRRSYAVYRLGALRWFLGGLAGIALAIALSTFAVQVLKRPGLGVFIVAAALLGVFATVTGAGGLLRAARFRRALERAQWQRARLRVAGAHLRLIFAHAAAEDVRAQTGEDDDGSRALDARLMTTSRWRVRSVVGNRDGAVRLCPLGGESYVLTAQGLDNLYGLLPLARRRGRVRP